MILKHDLIIDNIVYMNAIAGVEYFCAGCCI